jgi:hypothetical protein
MTDVLPFTKSETSMLFGLIVGFFLIPYLPTELLITTDLFLVRLVLLVGLLVISYRNPLLGIAAFVLISYIFIERNKAKLRYLKQSMELSTKDSEAIVSIQTPVTAPDQPSFDIPKSNSIPFMPSEDSGDNTFEPVAPSIDTKQPLPTETSSGSDHAIHQLFKWVHPAA